MQWVLGLMSGTSLDGIDAAVIQTDGTQIGASGPCLSRPFDAHERRIMENAVNAAQNRPFNPEQKHIRKAQECLTRASAQCVLKLRQISKPSLIGFHGQTLLHRPQEKQTFQIGDAKLLARLTQLPVVYDFRSADIAAGGQGAPLAPLYHQALAKKNKLPQPFAILNIGGIANLTWSDKDQLIAFDTGPGNGLMDDWAKKYLNAPFDHKGALAAKGSVNQNTLETLLKNPFFARKPPKSLDRADFSIQPCLKLSPQNGAATLAAFTALSAINALKLCPKPPDSLILSGGGRHNAHLVSLFKKNLNIPLLTAEDAGWRGDSIEAEAFAFLALRSINKQPISFPLTTGAPVPLTGGKTAPPPPDP